MDAEMIRDFDPGKHPAEEREMLEWLILPALLLIVVLAIVTAKPAGDGGEANKDGPEK